MSEKTIGRFYGSCFGKPSQRARGFGKDVVRDKNNVVGVLAVPAGAAQKVADDLVDAGVRIIFNYSEGLFDAAGDGVPTSRCSREYRQRTAIRFLFAAAGQDRFFVCRNSLGPLKGQSNALTIPNA